VVKRSVPAKITYIRFIRLSEVTDALAEREGFTTAEESKAWLRETYSIRSDKRWLVCICWNELDKPALVEYTGIVKAVERKRTILDHYLGLGAVKSI